VGGSLGVRQLADGFAASLTEELDYRIEADNVAAVAGALPPDSCVRIRRSSITSAPTPS
jgi:ubiquinone biosynthesis protein